MAKGEVMAVIVYALCTVASLLCAWLLFQSWLRSRYRLLLWSGLCFSGLTLNNLIVVLDKIVFPDTDLRTLRLAVALLALLPLLVALINEER